MINTRPICLLILIPIWLNAVTGCASPTSTHTLDSGVNVVSFDATRRGVYIREMMGSKDRILVVAEPAPDVAKEITALLDTSLQGLDGVEAAKVKAEYNARIVDLARRSQTLQILRESLYRLSELHANGAISDQQVGQLYLEVLRAVQTIALTELGNSDLPDASKARYLNDYLDKIKSGDTLNPTN